MEIIAIVSFTNYKKGQNRAVLSKVLQYSAQDKKTIWNENKLVSALNCTPQSVYSDFISTKLLHHKEDKRMFYHMVQSFPKGEDVPPEQAHEMAMELANHFEDYEVLVCTHIERDHIHSHFIINSVAFDSGKKLHLSTPDIENIRQKNDELCLKFWFEVCTPKLNKGKKTMSSKEYRSAAKGQSWKIKMMTTIDDCMKFSKSKEQFIRLMKSEGYQINWTEDRKSITYTTPNGMKCRDIKLHEEKYWKENMEHEFRIREEFIARRTERTEQIAGETRDTTDQLQRGNTGADGTCDRTLELSKQSNENDISITTTDARAVETDESPLFVGRTEQEIRENTRQTVGNGQDDITGWEQEREFLFHPKKEVASITDVHANSGYDTRNDFHVANVADDLLQLCATVEGLGNSEPIKDSTTMPTQKVSKKRRTGQKEEDHRSGHNFTMRM